MTSRAKIVNISKGARLSRPLKPEYSWTGMWVGIFVGNFIGFIAEVISGRGMLVMAVGIFSGMFAGGVFELIRLWVRRRRFCQTRKH
jgi:hypothetical protein